MPEPIATRRVGDILKKIPRKIGSASESIRRVFRYAFKVLAGRPIRIFCESNWRLGDEIMMFPCYEALKKKYPGSVLSVKTHYPELLALIPHVDEVNPPTDVCDLYLCLRGGEKGVERRATLERRIGCSFSSQPIRIEPDMKALPPEVKDKRGLRFVFFHTASQPCKRWPRERFRTLSSWLLTFPDSEVIEVGRDVEPLGIGTNLIGRTTPVELAAVLRSADLFIGNDSGPLHLALAVGTPAVGLFGSTEPDLLFPPLDRFFPVKARSVCRGCWSKEEMAYPGGVCPRDCLECMESIAASDVEEAVKKALAWGSLDSVNQNEKQECNRHHE
jgi:ADP-heptose:LPS heptosyltransferase